MKQLSSLVAELLYKLTQSGGGGGDRKVISGVL